MNTTRASSSKETYTLEVQVDSETGESLIELPQSLLSGLGWKEGDTLEWIELPSGSWSISKITLNKEAICSDYWS